MNHPRLSLAALGAALCLPLIAAAAIVPAGDLKFSVEHMDRSVSPGVDFAKYAWGGWATRTAIPADKARWGSGDMLGENNWARIRQILEDAAAKSGAPGSTPQKVGDFYASAMDTVAIDAAGIKPLQPTLDRIAAIKSVDDLIAAVADAQNHIGGPLFGTAIYADFKDNSKIRFYLAQGGLSLPTRDYYFDEKYAKFRDEFVVHVAKMFELAGAAPEAAKADAATVFALEKALAEVSKPPTELRNPLANYNKMTRAEAAAAMPGFPLERYLTLAEIPASEQEIIVMQPKFFATLGTMLEPRLADWKVYLRYHAIKDSAPFLAAAFDDESFRFFGQVLNGTPQQEPRWQRVAKRMDGQVGYAISELYVARYFPPAVKARLDGMIAIMKDVLRDRIKQLDWMTDGTKAKALEKLAAYRVMVGAPPKWRDYSGLTIGRDSFYTNVWNASYFEVKRQLAKFGQPFDRDEFLASPHQVNAYNQPSANQLVFLAGILQPPYFDAEMDDAVNFGAICAVIGHEITHGFDDQGRLYDATGNLKDWWTEKDAAEFKARSDKLVNQFGAYEALPGLKVNGQLTLGENIADLAGVSIAYEALERSLVGKERKLIDGLTPEQRFFLSWAQVWKTKTRDERMKFYLQADVHSPGEFRAYGPLVNVQEFYDAFGIKEGDPMWKKPEERAKIW
ncbi:MAG: M13 family metallopeptidase [Opitutae bacterium]|nr:M13 family metallopeptidase [Opitutae bacterium]